MKKTPAQLAWEGVAKSDELFKKHGPNLDAAFAEKMEWLASVHAPKINREEFDRMTAKGYKLNLLTGEYYK